MQLGISLSVITWCEVSFEFRMDIETPSMPLFLRVSDSTTLSMKDTLFRTDVLV